MLSRLWSKKPGESGEMNIEKLKKALNEAESVLIGAGSGLSTSAGFVYTGERFRNYFSDFEERYGFHDMYSGGFYPYDTLEEHWAYWSRYIWINRYMDAPKPVYEKLLDLVKDKDYFVLTTNVDHCFQKAGFEKHRLFYTQGDYGLFQCSKPCHPKNYENEEMVRQMVQAQGFEIAENGELILTDGTVPKRQIPSELVPYCPKCGKPMAMNLRADDTFVEDEGWHRAAERYADFLRRHQNGKHSGNHQVPILAENKSKPECSLCLRKLRGGCGTGTDCGAVGLRGWGYWGVIEKIKVKSWTISIV